MQQNVMRKMIKQEAKGSTHVTLQPLSKMGEKNTQQPLISISSGTSNGKDQGSSNGKNQVVGVGKDEGGTSSVTMKRKRNPNARSRGIKLVKEMVKKLGVEFYNNGVVGDNFKAFLRHLGKLVHDHTMCPIRVHSWDEIQPEYLDTMWATVVEEIISVVDKHPEFSQFELIKKCFGPQDHDYTVCFGHGVTPKDLQGPQPSKVDLVIEIQEKNQQINSLTGHVDALELNHQK
ncbi:hypothetical protein Cgig2_033929 [Carnegiea gigantea]|uniref:Uncharacterized protein n=1 Tax=Carnegiea gigantea TaxID=171969 RepID=A0A9Q1JMU4_9CARY|nr:hypothetical protein Cgig2_033929 [Carnegiea gigantea]